ncbi:hypothetical protein [Jiangella alkaliphila]|uniref:hypothetical protein n=1 Tax=Jiangella alkaliphila TaxID=419479 RepID=UPI0012FC18A7|nr:hypothetical protein [Jiangella alkaliphila]
MREPVALSAVDALKPEIFLPASRADDPVPPLARLVVVPAPDMPDLVQRPG